MGYYGLMFFMAYEVEIHRSYLLGFLFVSGGGTSIYGNERGFLASSRKFII